MLPAFAAEGPIVVFCPLVALMQEQLAIAAAAGLTARRFPCAGGASADLLFAAPEVLGQPGAAAALAAVAPALIVVDEAHCVLDWSDFRPAFELLGPFLSALVPRPPLLALTATANAAERERILAALGRGRAMQFVGACDRPNITMGVQWMDPGDAVAAAADLVKRQASGRALVYFATRAGADSGAQALRSSGIAAAPFHAEIGPDQKDEVYDFWRSTPSACVCATSGAVPLLLLVQRCTN
jgi:superfamily II DNA helicase RecQ